MSAPAPLLGEKQTSGGRLAVTDLMSTHPQFGLMRTLLIHRSSRRAEHGWHGRGLAGSVGGAVCV